MKVGGGPIPILSCNTHRYRHRSRQTERERGKAFSRKRSLKQSFPDRESVLLTSTAGE